MPAAKISPAELAKRIDPRGLAQKYHIDLSQLQQTMALTIDQVKPEAPKQGDELQVSYTVTNLTLSGAHGTVRAQFQHHDLTPVSGGPVTAIDLAPGASLSGAMKIHPTETGMSPLVVAYRDETNCGTAPDGHGGQVTVCQNTYGTKTSVDLNVAADLSHVDADNDAIPDSLEDEMLARYRPFYRFSNDGAEEPIRPTDPIWYIRHSSLLTDGNESSTPAVPNSILQLTPEAVFTVTAKAGPSNFMANACSAHYFLNPDNDFRSGFHSGDGFDWPDVVQRGNIGLYGHVRKDPNQSGIYNVEYWQFYGFNDANAPSWFAKVPLDLAGLKQALQIADHEGDWEGIMVSVELDPTTNEHHAVSTTHYVHGRPVQFFNIPNALTSAISVSSELGLIKELHGPDFDNTPADLDLNDDGGLNRAQNKVLQLFCPSADECTHPVVYVEWGTHASWPSARWNFYRAPNHNGNGQFHYLTAPPPNLGEVEHPRATTPGSTIILQYNGEWGAFSRDNSSPHGPALHKSWTRSSLDRPSPDCLE